MARLSLLKHPQPSDLELEDGRRLEIHELVGKGSASSVYRATIESPYGLRRNVAAKVFGTIASDDSDNVSAAIAQGAQRSALVNHPNVVETFDYLMFQGQPVLLLELVEGTTAGTLLDRYRERRARMPLDLALFIALETAQGLSGARSARGDDGVQLGLVHCALTPREILLSWRGEVKVEGFGLDVARAGTSSVRSLRGVAGRAQMMAPEVASGTPGDARADVFSLGVLLRELLVGPRFPNGITNADALRLAREGYIHPIPFSPNLPTGLADVITRALAIDPEERYPSSAPMSIELRRIALSMGVGDMRYFLRRALDRELRDGLEEDTQEVVVPDALDDRD